MKSFSEYLNSLCEEDEEKKLQDLNDDCDEGDCNDKNDKGEEDDDKGDDVNESAQLRLDLLQQIQPKLAKAPLNVLKQILKRLDSTDDE